MNKTITTRPKQSGCTLCQGKGRYKGRPCICQREKKSLLTK